MQSPPNAHASWGKGGRKMGEVCIITQKTGPKRIRPSSLIKYSVCRFLALTPDIQKLVRLISAH